MARTLQSLALDNWVEPAGNLADIASAVDGRIVARVSSAGLDFAAMARHAREVRISPASCLPSYLATVIHSPATVREWPRNSAITTSSTVTRTS